MATLFTKIIDGEIPGTFIYQDDVCVAFLTIEPQTDGHALVVPREEIDQWTDLDQKTLHHLMAVAQRIGKAQQQIWNPERIGLQIEGYGVPHVHLHVWPTWSTADFDVANVHKDVSAETLEQNAQKIKAALKS
ncbi:MAG: HIT family protein [Micrococcaceae bacterium]